MKLYRVRPADGGEPTWAVLREGRLQEVQTPFGGLHDALSDVGAGLSLGEDLGKLSEADVLAPAEPTKIVCVGRNYRRHAEELGNPIPEEPLIFLKPPSALIGPGDAIVLPEQSREVHHEGELALVIGERARHIDRPEAVDRILGYTCANDVTARDIQRREGKFTRGKGFDTFCPVGPALRQASEFIPDAAYLSCRVDGEQRQHSRLDDFIFDISQIIAFVSSVMTLEPGDLVLTGTPAGVGPIKSGQRVEVEVDGLGVLSNPVVDQAEA